MMDSTVEAKLNKFSSSVMNDAHKKLEALEAEINAQKESKIESKYDEFLTKAYEQIQDCISKIRKEDNEKVRNAEFEAKKVLLKRREDIIEDVFATAQKKLLEFRNSDGYVSWLKEKVHKALKEAGDGRKECYLTEQDSEYIKGELLEDAELATVSEKDFWGGVRIRNLEKGILVDYSFYELLEGQRADFLQNSGLTID